LKNIHKRTSQLHIIQKTLPNNDPAKQGKRVYGTLANVFHMTYIQKYSNSEPVHIYLHAGPYTEEIKAQLLSNCPHAAIYEL
jgi:hypothetical protein